MHLRLGVALSFMLLAACSTPSPVHNSKKGFFDHLSDMEEKSSMSRGETVMDHEEGIIPHDANVTRYNGVDLSWPVDVPEVTSPYGPRGRRFHDGVDLRANVGTPVYAAHDGNVIYSGRKVGGYGRVIVIKHDTGLTSIYAHNSKLLVKSGAEVRRGDKIAISGRSGRVRGPHVHFELRDGILAFNPIELLGQVPLANRTEDMHEIGPIDDEPIRNQKKPKTSRVAGGSHE